MMEMKRIDISALSDTQILALLEVAQGFSAALPNWSRLRARLEAGEAWAFCDGAALAGFALVDTAAPHFDGAAQLTMLRYRWEYNSEAALLWMLTALAQTYRSRFRYLLLDVNGRHELNLELYRRFGFQNSILRSPRGGENIILLADLTSLKTGQGGEKE